MKSGKPDFGFRNEIRFYTFGKQNLEKKFEMSGKINLHICLMSGVYKSFHQTVKCGQQRSYILQDLAKLEI